MNVPVDEFWSMGPRSLSLKVKGFIEFHCSKQKPQADHKAAKKLMEAYKRGDMG